MADLNSNSFPLDTNTFPLTKKLKAELAGVIVIAVFGTVSQLRVWKLVKEHRAKSATNEIEKQKDQDREEEELGRKIQDSLQRERAQWESMYGEKSTQESSVASLKEPGVVQEREVSANNSLEMVNRAQGDAGCSMHNDSPAGATVADGVLDANNTQQVDAQGNAIPCNKISNDTSAALSDAGQPLALKNNSLRASVPPPPPVVPLPFTVPEESEANDEDDNTSISAVPESEHESITNGRPMVSKRISDMSGARHGNGVSRDVFESQEHMMSHGDDRRASSVAATLDDDQDDMSIHQLSPTHSLVGTERDASDEQQNVDLSANVRSEAAAATEADEAHVRGGTAETDNGRETTGTSDDSPAQPTVCQSLTASTDPKEDEASRKGPSRRESQVDTAMTGSKEGKEGSESQQPKSGASVAMSAAGSPKNVLASDRLSKVALSYRTNEWAKHLEAADKPELDELAAPASPGVTVERYAEEQPAPVSDEIAAPLMGNRRSSRRMSSGSAVMRNRSFGPNRSTANFSRNSLEQRTMSRPPSAYAPGGHSRSNSGTNQGALLALPGNTLLSQRESRMKDRVSSQSLTPYTPSATLGVEQGEQEDMTLAQRRQLLQKQTSPTKDQHQQPATSPRHAPPSTSQKWQKKGLGVAVGPVGFDSHAPRRMSSSQTQQKREELFAGWRESVQDVKPRQTAAVVAEQQRVALLNEKRQKEMRQQQRESIAQQRASKMDQMMRSGQMLDVHREAMRKMQASANKNV